jgi:hypothetical protein
LIFLGPTTEQNDWWNRKRRGEARVRTNVYGGGGRRKKREEEKRKKKKKTVDVWSFEEANPGGRRLKKNMQLFLLQDDC